LMIGPPSDAPPRDEHCYIAILTRWDRLAFWICFCVVSAFALAFCSDFAFAELVRFCLALEVFPLPLADEVALLLATTLVATFVDVLLDVACDVAVPS